MTDSCPVCGAKKSSQDRTINGKATCTKGHTSPKVDWENSTKVSEMTTEISLYGDIGDSW